MSDSSDLTVDAIGEFALIDRIRRIASRPGVGVIRGIGDDTAVLQPSPGNVLLATVDVMVEGVHFLRQATNPASLGRRALAVNLSDIAAKGGQPRWALVSLGLPPHLRVSFVEDVYVGMVDEAAAFGASIVGGNLARSPERVVVDVTLLGEVAADRVLYRSGARPGDRVFVTGTLGDSAAGLALLLGTLPVDSNADPSFAALIDRHRLPTPRVAVGAALAASGVATAAMDLSDGLASDVPHLAAASGVGVTIWADRLPLSSPLRRLAALTGRDPLDWAVRGGEDYELLFTSPVARVPELLKAVQPTGVTVTEIGIVTIDRAIQLAWSDGRRAPLGTAGFSHFG